MSESLWPLSRKVDGGYEDGVNCSFDFAFSPAPRRRYCRRLRRCILCCNACTLGAGEYDEGADAASQ